MTAPLVAPGRTVTEAYSLFQQPWWLDAVAPGAWQEVNVAEGGRTVARMPFVLRRRLGMTRIMMPPLTRELGPWVAEQGEGVDAQATARARVRQLIGKLPHFTHCHMRLAPEAEDWFPFHEAGFEQTTRYTYRLEDLRDLDAIRSGFRDGMRRHLRKAEQCVRVRTDLGLDALLALVEKSYQRQGRAFRIPREVVERIDRSCAARGARALFCAVDAQDRIHAAAYFVGDAQATFWLLSGGDPELRASGANSLLVWEGVRWAASRSRLFDFEGSMQPGIERYIAGFGGRRVSYHAVRAASRAGRVAMAARDLLRALAH